MNKGIGTHIKEVLLSRTIWFVGIAAGFCLVTALLPTYMSFEKHGNDEVPVSPEVALIEQLFGSGDCWAGEAPADVDMPGHVVVTLNADEDPRYLGPEFVQQALEQVFANVDHGIYRIHGFCR